MITMTRLWLCLLATTVYIGCTSGRAPTVHYYTLHGNPPAMTLSKPAVPLNIGIGPLELPEYLDRAAMVTRQSANRLMVNESHRWAGSLSSEILRVLADHLAASTGATRVAVFPWHTNFEPDVRIRINIQTFEGRRGESVSLNAGWTLAAEGSSQTVVHRMTQVEQSIKGRDYEDVAAAMGQALETLSREMAAAIAEVKSSKNKQ